jgi:hypothetical protein
MTKDDHTMTRREFIGWSARFLLLGGLFALFARHGRADRKSQDVCTDPKGYCRTCSALEYCGHPTARSFKAAPTQTKREPRT